MTKWAMIGLMVRRLEPPPGGKPWQRASTAAVASSKVVYESGRELRAGVS